MLRPFGPDTRIILKKQLRNATCSFWSKANFVCDVCSCNYWSGFQFRSFQIFSVGSFLDGGDCKFLSKVSHAQQSDSRWSPRNCWRLKVLLAPKSWHDLLDRENGQATEAGPATQGLSVLQTSRVANHRFTSAVLQHAFGK